MTTRSLPTFALLATLTGVAFGADPTKTAGTWPQWRGPNRDDVSKEKGLLAEWPKGGPKLLWTFDDAGTGYSGFAVVGDRMYTMGADEKTEYLFALDLKTRKKLWSAEIGPRFSNGYGDGPRGTPTVDGDSVFALGGQGFLVCVKTGTGDKVWTKRLKQDLDGVMMSGWGYTESPLVDGDQVVVTPGGNKGAVAALDKKTGEVLWQSKEFTDKAAYSSLVPANIGGVRQYVQMTGESVAGVAAKDGALLWRFERRSNVAAIPTPIVAGDQVYVSSGYGTGCAKLTITSGADGFKAVQDYANKDLVNHHGGVVKVGDYVYGYADGKGWTCMDFKTGKVMWADKSFPKGCLTYADGHLYCYAETDGSIALVEASPKDKLKVTGRFTIPKTSKMPRPPSRRKDNIWTHPVVADGKLYLRDQEFIFCYDVSDGKSS